MFKKNVFFFCFASLPIDTHYYYYYFKLLNLFRQWQADSKENFGKPQSLSTPITTLHKNSSWKEGA